MRKVFNAHDAVEVSRMISVLEEQGIRAYSMDAASDVAAHHVSGFGLYGVDIMTTEEDEEKAIVIITEISRPDK